jgi:hypothetical protein
VAFSPDGQRIASSSDGGVVKVWDSRHVTDVIEGEAMRVIGRMSGKASSHEIRRLGPDRWGIGEQLLWTDAKPKDRLDLQLPVATTGRYDLDVVLTKAPEYAIVQLAVDGKPLGERIDLYRLADGNVTTDSSNAIAARVLSFSGHELTAGLHKLSVEIVGANPKALPRYLFGLDYVRLRPVAP